MSSSGFVSIATVPAQPNQPVYAFTALNLFPTFSTRAELIAAGGPDPATYDQTQLTKTWADASPPAVDANGNVSYQSYDQSGNSITLKMTPAQAGAFNLPGYHTYPVYTVAPTDAYIDNGGGVPNSLFNANLLSDSVTGAGGAAEPGADVVALASALAAALGQTNALPVSDGSPTGAYPLVYPSDESRRVWQIAANGLEQNAGELLIAQNANGVGAPGKWSFDPSGAPQWVSGVVALTGQPNALMAVPMRPLLPNEEVIQVLGGVEIARTDVPGAVTNSGGTGGGLTAAQSASLENIEAMLTALMNWNHVPLP